MISKVASSITTAIRPKRIATLLSPAFALMTHPIRLAMNKVKNKIVDDM